MKWFENIFGSTHKKQNGSSLGLSEDSEPLIKEDLFLNNEQPIMNNNNVSNDFKLSSYLEQDFYRKGIEDGYDGHASEVMENKIKSLKADFRFNLNLKMDSLSQELLKMQNHKLEISGMSDRLSEQLDNQINSINANITELESQIALSSLDEGLIMVAIHQYRDGFIRGTEAYQQEKLIAGSTGLFN